MKIITPVTRGLYLTSAATSLIAMTSDENAEAVDVLRVQVADATGVLLPALPTDARGLALWCLKEAEKIVEAITPFRNASGVVIEPTGEEPPTKR